MGNFWSKKHDQHIRFDQSQRQQQQQLQQPTTQSKQDLFHQLSHQSPCFPVRAQNLHFIETPTEFYNQLLHGVQHAQQHILLCSLYLGVGEQEQKLVKAIHDSMEQRPDLKLTVMLDYLRGTRGTKRLTTGATIANNNNKQQIGDGSNESENEQQQEQPPELILDPSSSSTGILLPLLQKFGPERVQIFLYHTPSIGPLLRKIIPERVDEIIGVQHMKCYMFDDRSMILSGANLSDWYFVDRQDRYVSIRDQSNICQFFRGLIVDTVASFSYRLCSSGDLVYPDRDSDPMYNSKQFVQKAQHTVRQFMHREYDEKLRRQILEEEQEQEQQEREQEIIEKNSEQFKEQQQERNDTWIFPVIQMGQLKVRHDENVTRSVIEHASVTGRLSLGSAYFNLTKQYMQSVLHSPCQNINIITAAPISNGFFTAKGMSGYIPKAYDYMEQQFFHRVQRQGRQDEIKIFEYLRKGWTFHAKGLWLFAPGDTKPCLTIIGSSNFGQRSTERDVEAQIIVLTENEQLKSDMQQEHDRLFNQTRVVTQDLFKTPDRRIGLFMRLVTRFFFQKFL